MSTQWICSDCDLTFWDTTGFEQHFIHEHPEIYYGED